MATRFCRGKKETVPLDFIVPRAYNGGRQMGLDELSTYKYIIRGNGHIR